MKNFTIIVFLVLALLKTQAQDYLISFAGAGGTTVVGTVKVDNLTSGATVTLNGGDILHLKHALGIESQDMNNITLHIYPNPMDEQSMLTFFATENGNANICIVDLSGKTVCQTSTMLSIGVHSYRISGINRGMCFVKVTGINYNYSTKLISQSNLQGEEKIEYVSSTQNQLKNSTGTIDMSYTNGDQLLYTGTSGIYSNIVTDVPVSSKTITFNFVGCTDIDGNNYATVQIGMGKSATQIWMAENLNVGVRINRIQNSTNNGIIEKYCYHDSINNCSTYGGLYQWGELVQYLNGASDTTFWNPVPTGNVQGICPTGWHIPTDAEWTILTDFLGGDSIAGEKMMETGQAHWFWPNTGATNSSGFTALPGGYGTYGFSGTFQGITGNGYFYSASEDVADGAWFRGLASSSGVMRGMQNKASGMSVRCIKD